MSGGWEEIRIRPGLAGYASEPVNDQEAIAIQNMVLSRDGVWSARPGLTTQWTAPADIVHLSNHPNGRVMAVANNNLYRLNPAGAWAVETVQTGGWAGGVGAHVAACQAEWEWLGCQASSQSGTSDDIFRVNNAGGINQVTSAGSYQATYLCQHNRLVLAADRNTGRLWWSDDGNIASAWPATQSMFVGDIGLIEGLCNLSDSQTLVIGSLGLQMVVGTDSNSLAFPTYSGFIGCGNGATIAKCGDTVLWQDFNGQVRGFRGVGERVDLPINSELLTAYPPDSRGWFDAGQNWYGLSNRFTGKSYIYDLTRGQWLTTLDKVLVGSARPNTTSQQFQRYPVLGYGTKLVQWGGTDYLDDGSGFQCFIESRPTEQGALDVQKQIRRIYLDAVGSWTVFLYGRANPTAAWTELWNSGVVSGPVMLRNLGRHLYHQRKIRVEATAAAAIRFRELALWERAVRRPR